MTSNIQQKARKSAFTLIEILTVVAIIAILAAILFPVFARARESARRASCASNLKQIGLAILMYVQDYDETMPHFKAYNVPGGTVYWSNYIDRTVTPNVYRPERAYLQQYMKNTQIQDCPTAAYIPPSPSNKLYEFVAFAVNTDYIYLPNSPVKLASFTAPSETIVMADVASMSADTSVIRGANLYPPSRYYSSSGALKRPNVHGRHNGMANVLWADGHVKAMKVTPRPETNYGGSITAEKLAQQNLGDILPNNTWTGDCVKDDYYFRVDKENPPVFPIGVNCP